MPGGCGVWFRGRPCAASSGPGSPGRRPAPGTGPALRARWPAPPPPTPQPNPPAVSLYETTADRQTQPGARRPRLPGVVQSNEGLEDPPRPAFRNPWAVVFDPNPAQASLG